MIIHAEAYADISVQITIEISIYLYYSITYDGNERFSL